MMDKQRRFEDYTTSELTVLEIALTNWLHNAHSQLKLGADNRACRTLLSGILEERSIRWVAEQDQKETTTTQRVTTQLRVGYFVTINSSTLGYRHMVREIDDNLGVKLNGLKQRFDISELTVVEIADEW